jgi:GT2 family glycosyltransferase
MSQPDLSVCIVNWNARELLRGCLTSLEQACSGLNVEVIVVDNASADGSADMVAREFPHARLVRNTANLGFARANNQAAALSSGRYLLFLNNDTLVGRDSLRAILAFMEEHPEVGMAGPRLIGRDGRPQRSYRARPTVPALLHRLALLRWTGLFRRAYQRYRRRDFDPHTLRPVEALLGAAVCLPRAVFTQHGGWDEEFPFGLEDFDLSARVARTHQVVFLPAADIIHLGKMSSRQNAGFAYTGVECGYVRYLRKHVLGPTAVRAYKLLVTLDLPLALLVELARAGWRRWRRGPAAPGRPHTDLAALWYFSTRGLALFWRS